ncbi:MAG: hypothetical protein LBO80_02820 [Treponema sp.]|nr:hypothetical protein [Treponema sp.]
MGNLTGCDNGTNGDPGNTDNGTTENPVNTERKQLIISGFSESSITVAVYQQGTANDQAFISQTGFIAGYNGIFNTSTCIIDLFNNSEYWRGTGTFDIFIKTTANKVYKKQV